ncbi:MAG: hypothetical protein HY513_00835 [Candidatus Aenigmarchaeota archaeon]|nr:hypothetical protein [Candidatus Aenigmarchaeota archaeon]
MKIIMVLLLAILALPAVSFAAAPDLFPVITTASKPANVYSVYVIIKNIGDASSGPYALKLDYGDGMLDNKNITTPIGIKKSVSHRFDHVYKKSGLYSIKATVTVKNDKNTFNNNVERKFNVIVRKASTPTGKVTEKSVFETFLSKMIEMLG